jgi:putative Mn2+ efflux pump MntP
MSFSELFILAVGLSMDAFAVSVCKGLCAKKISAKEMCIAGIWFGGFQALMPFLGWLLGSSFSSRIEKIDHWVAFAILALIGGNMIKESLGESEKSDDSFALKTMFLMAVATSIDAFAVGITFSFFYKKILPLISACIFICCVTFLFSAAGVKIGSVFGNKFEKKAERSGGIILILLGLKILLSGLGVLK